MGRKKVYGHKHYQEQNVMDAARERVSVLFDLFDTVSVSFSGGKDSTVVLNLVEQEAIKRGRTPVEVHYFDEEAIPYDVAEYIRRIMLRPSIDLTWYAIPIKHRNVCSREEPFFYPWAPEKRDLWVMDMPPEATTTLEGYDYTEEINRKSLPQLSGLLFPPEKYGSVVEVMGIRADESMTRYRAVAHLNNEYNWIKNWGSGFSGDEKILHYGNAKKAYPIYDFMTTDVWTAIKKEGWDYCEFYDKLEMLGVPHLHQRLAPPFGEQPAQRLWMYQVTYPELWDKMVYRVKGANTAAKYFGTQLYSGYVGDVDNFDPTYWHDLIADKLKLYKPSLAQQCAERIRGHINRHYSITNDPILTVPHFNTGVDWPWLVMVAEKGDFKGRYDPKFRIGSDAAKVAKKKRTYYDKLEEFKAWLATRE